MEIKKNEFYLSYILLGINIAIFIIMVLIDPNITTKTVINFGAKVNYKIADGELYRLITPMFLHLNLYHIIFNSLALYILGRDIEKIFGKTKFLLIYFIAGIISSIGSFTFNEAISAGASGAIFGLLGAHLYLYFTNKQVYKKIYGNSFLVLIGINIAYGFIHPNIDNVGHIFGLLGGLLVSYAIGHRYVKISNPKNIALIILIPIIIFSSLFYGIRSYKNSVNYYVYKGYFLIQTEEYDQAYDVLIEGKEQYPSQGDFDYLINNFIKK